MHFTPDNPLTNVYRHSALALPQLTLDLLFVCTTDALPHNLFASTSPPTLVKRRQNTVTLKQNWKKKKRICPKLEWFQRKKASFLSHSLLSRA